MFENISIATTTKKAIRAMLLRKNCILVYYILIIHSHTRKILNRIWTIRENVPGISKKNGIPVKTGKISWLLMWGHLFNSMSTYQAMYIPDLEARFFIVFHAIEHMFCCINTYTQTLAWFMQIVLNVRNTIEEPNDKYHACLYTHIIKLFKMSEYSNSIDIRLFCWIGTRKVPDTST